MALNRFPSSESRLLYFIERLGNCIEGYEDAIAENRRAIHVRADWIKKRKAGDGVPSRTVNALEPLKAPTLPSEISDFIHADSWRDVIASVPRLAETEDKIKSLAERSDLEAIEELQSLETERATLVDKGLDVLRDYRTGCFAMLDHVRNEKPECDTCSTSRDIVERPDLQSFTQDASGEALFKRIQEYRSETADKAIFDTCLKDSRPLEFAIARRLAKKPLDYIRVRALIREDGILTKLFESNAKAPSSPIMNAIASSLDKFARNKRRVTRAIWANQTVFKRYQNDHDCSGIPMNAELVGSLLSFGMIAESEAVVRLIETSVDSSDAVVQIGAAIKRDVVIAKQVKRMIQLHTQISELSAKEQELLLDKQESEDKKHEREHKERDLELRLRQANESRPVPSHAQDVQQAEKLELALRPAIDLGLAGRIHEASMKLTSTQKFFAAMVEMVELNHEAASWKRDRWRTYLGGGSYRDITPAMELLKKTKAYREALGVPKGT